jgi:hypothetical protein
MSVDGNPMRKITMIQMKFKAEIARAGPQQRCFWPMIVLEFNHPMQELKNIARK